MSNRIKQIIVMRKDLKMRRGKEIAQGSHASMAFLTRALEHTGYGCIHRASLSNVMQEWLNSSFAKVTLQVSSEDELMEIHDEAVAAGLEVHLVIDSGVTEFKGVPTKTCLAIGPDFSHNIDPVTSKLKLY